MKALILGATGLLGPAFIAVCKERGVQTVTSARSGADFNLDLSDLSSLLDALATIRPDCVVNCAAKADLSACEANPAGAYLANARPAAALASWSQDRRLPFIQVSTDCFFTGAGKTAHDEQAPIVVWNEYARTKRAGEILALTSPHALVLRTNILGARKGFARFVLDLIEHRHEAVLFDDFFTSPIHVRAFAHAAIDLLDVGARGLFNLAGAEIGSKREVAEAIAAAMGQNLDWVKGASVRSISPRRAESLGLDVRKAQSALGRTLPDLKQTAAMIIEEER